MTEWIYNTCPECGQRYSYPLGQYKPATCGRFECVHRHAHPELKARKEVMPQSYTPLGIGGGTNRN